MGCVCLFVIRMPFGEIMNEYSLIPPAFPFL